MGGFTTVTAKGTLSIQTPVTAVNNTANGGTQVYYSSYNSSTDTPTAKSVSQNVSITKPSIVIVIGTATGYPMTGLTIRRGTTTLTSTGYQDTASYQTAKLETYYAIDVNPPLGTQTYSVSTSVISNPGGGYYCEAILRMVVIVIELS